jgi:hypothetical protein
MAGRSEPHAPRPRRRLASAGGIVLLVLGLVALLRPTRIAELPFEGHTFRVPLHVWATRLDGDEAGAVRYLGLGDPTFGSTEQLEYREQLGSSHHLVGDGVRVEIVTRKRSRWFTEISLRAASRP